MDITAHNFKKNIKVVQEAINDATFMTMDAEFTGLNNGKILHAFDTPEERYTKLREGALDFLLIQFGLCTFKSIENKRYEQKAFNFFVFPKPFRRNHPDARFMCQSSCLDFLLNQRFDFNRWLRDGISYLSPVDEKKLKEQLEQKHYQQDHAPSIRLDSHIIDEIAVRSPVPIPEQHKAFVDSTCKKIEDFTNSTSEILELEPCNSFLRKLIFQAAKQRFPSGLYLESKANPKKDWYIVVTKANLDKLQEMEKAKKHSEVEELDDAIGFTKIIKMITSSGKPVIGHNMMLDLMHVIHKFCCPLPADFEDFKAVTKCVFPRLFDTKLIASTYPFKEKINRTMLGDLFRILEKEPFSIPGVEVAHGFRSYNTNEEQLHEAGYDAYITGLCFISMAQYMGTFEDPKKNSSTNPNWTLLEPFKNKLYLMRVQDIPYINLSGEDMKPNRNHVFHVTFPKEWKTSDLMQLFEPFGHVFVSLVDETSAFVALTKKEQAALVMRTLTQSDIYHVLAYSEYAMRRKKPNPYAAMLQDGVRKGEKRLMPASDVNTKRVRRGSCGEDSINRRSIEPIPEEDESESADSRPSSSSSKSSEDTADDSDADVDEEDAAAADDDDDDDDDEDENGDSAGDTGTMAKDDKMDETKISRKNGSDSVPGSRLCLKL